MTFERKFIRVRTEDGFPTTITCWEEFDNHGNVRFVPLTDQEHKRYMKRLEELRALAIMEKTGKKGIEEFKKSMTPIELPEEEEEIVIVKLLKRRRLR